MTSKQQNLRAMLERVEADYIVNALLRTGGNVAAAARDLEVPLSTLWFKIKRHGIDHANPTTEGIRKRVACPHGKRLGCCSACDVAADLAFDADRESR